MSCIKNNGMYLESIIVCISFDTVSTLHTTYTGLVFIKKSLIFFFETSHVPELSEIRCRI